MKKLRMESLGSYPVWLTGSRKTVQRTVYRNGGKFYCIWYSQVIELVHDAWGYYTVESY